MNKICIALLGFIAFITLYSCDEPTLVGQELIPDDDALALDSLDYEDIVFNMYRDDSILNSSVSEFRLGKSIDANIGNAIANVYAEAYFSGTMKRLKNGVFDSLVLYLNTTGFEGDSTISQTIQVFELADSLKSESEGYYYMKDSITVGNLLGEFTNVIYSSDSTYVNGVLSSSHLSTIIDPTFGSNLFQQMNDSIITTNHEFQNYFKGIGLKATQSATGGGWFIINNQVGSTALTGLSLYYHNADDTLTLTLPFIPLFDYTSDEGKYFAGSQNINQIQTLYTDGTIASQLNNYSPTGNSINTIASGNGAYVSLELDDLMNELNPNDVVNYAELTLKPTFTNLSDTLFLPETLIMGDKFVTNSDGFKTGSVFGIDATNVTGTPTNGRIFDNTQYAYRERLGVGDYRYRFQMPGTLQSMHAGIIPPIVYIISTGRATNFDHFTFASSDVTFKIIYSTK